MNLRVFTKKSKTRRKLKSSCVIWICISLPWYATDCGVYAFSYYSNIRVFMALFRHRTNPSLRVLRFHIFDIDILFFPVRRHYYLGQKQLSTLLLVHERMTRTLPFSSMNWWIHSQKITLFHVELSRNQQKSCLKYLFNINPDYDGRNTSNSASIETKLKSTLVCTVVWNKQE